MKSRVNKYFASVLAALVLACSVLSGSSVFASDTAVNEESESTAITYVNNITDLVTALTSGGEIHVAAGTYSIPGSFVIPADTHLIGDEDGETIFNTGTNTTNSQAGIYIYNDGVVLENITIQNSSSITLTKPPLKIEADNVSLINCTIIANNMRSALMMHASSNISITGCTFEKAYSGLLSSFDGYPVIQANAGTEVVITKTTITAGRDEQAHIQFAYDADSTTDYTAPSYVTIDSSVIFENGYENLGVIYDEAPNSLNRYDKVIVITEDYPEGITLERQTDNSIEGVTTADTGWYCYNLEAEVLEDYGYETEDGIAYISGEITLNE